MWPPQFTFLAYSLPLAPISSANLPVQESNHPYLCFYVRDQQIFSTKDQGINILGLASHTVAVKTIQVCQRSAEATISNTWKNECALS